MLNSIKNFCGRLLGLATDVLPLSVFETLTKMLVARRATKLPPAEGLRFLFRLDAHFYTQQSNLAVAYGQGIHPKHRHLKYHDFFAQRIGKNEKVLDIGCGYGALANSIVQKSKAHVTGIDLNEKNIEQARANYSQPNLTFIHGDALKELPGEVFDVIVLSNVLEHLTDRPEFLRKVYDTTGAPRFLIRVPMFNREWRVPLKKELGVDWRLDRTHELEYTREVFEQEMKEALLQITYFEVIWGEIWAELKRIDQSDT